MKYEYASVRITSKDSYELPMWSKTTKIHVVTPDRHFSGSLDNVYNEMEVGGEPCLVGIFSYLGSLGWRLCEISKTDIYFFERLIEEN